MRWANLCARSQRPRPTAATVASSTAGRKISTASRGNVFEPSVLSETLRPPLGVPEGDGNASGYHGRDRRLRPLRGEVGGVREYITDECCNRADRRLSRGAIDCPVHLCKKGNRNGRTDNPANRGEECVIETKRGQNVSARHHEKAGEPRPSKLFSGGARKPSCTQIIESIEDAELKASHR